MNNDIEYKKLNSIHMANVIAERIHIEKKMALTLAQKKLILYLASLIQQNDFELKESVISISDYFRLLGIEYGGNQKEKLKKSLLEICSKCFYLPAGNGRYDIVCRWLERAYIDYSKSEIHLKLDETLKPYFIQISEQARTIFQLGYVMQFQYKYSPDLYAFASRCKNLNAPYLMPIEEALQRFGENKYKDYANLKKWVLDKSVDEINKKSELKMYFKPQRNSRGKTTHVVFIVFKKTGKALEEANEWKKQLPKSKNIHDEIRELFEETIMDNAIDDGYLDYTDPDALSNFSLEEYLDWKCHLTKKEYSEV